MENVKMEGLETKLREVNMENLVLTETVWNNEDCILDLETRFNSSEQALKVEKKKHKKERQKIEQKVVKVHDFKVKCESYEENYIPTVNKFSPLFIWKETNPKWNL